MKYFNIEGQNMTILDILKKTGGEKNHLFVQHIESYIKRTALEDALHVLAKKHYIDGLPKDLYNQQLNEILEQLNQYQA